MSTPRTLLRRVGTWARDPFGRRELTQRHAEVLARMRTTTVILNAVSHERFPISRMVGSRHDFHGRAERHAP